MNQADQCERGWWYNLLYINNFVSDIHEDARLVGAGATGSVSKSVYLIKEMFVGTIWWALMPCGEKGQGMLFMNESFFAKLDYFN